MGLGKEKNRVNFDMIRAVLSTTLGVKKLDLKRSCLNETTSVHCHGSAHASVQ